MNKQQLVNELSEKISIDRTQAAEFIDAFVTTIKDGLKKQDKINISGLGTFMLLKRKAYVGKNPKTGQKLNVPELVFPYFKPSVGLKEDIK